jgi:uncharacterized membrane protein YhaH (DUF805 family)
MFNSPFAFRGRIRRLEFGITSVATWIFQWACLNILQTEPELMVLLIMLGSLIVFTWFFLAQGAKRCHDMGLSGWYQLIPLFNLYMLVKASDGPNKYGAPVEQQLPNL